jgi:hypothetical protein
VHYCRRCGHERRCSHGSWPDRHPVAAVTLAVIVLAMTVAHPWLLGCLVVGGAVYMAVRARGRRAALAARADWEHRALMAAPVPTVRPLAQRQAHSLPWQAISLLRTEPLRQVNGHARSS